LQNKPNFPYFSLKNDDFAEKQSQFKPNQSQFWPKNQGGKAKQTRLPQNALIGLCSFLTSKYENLYHWRVEKTKPIFTQFQAP
jgi:hypothetical protein